MNKSSSVLLLSSLDDWRDYFRTTPNSDIFEIIDKSITIAAFDSPKEFTLRRDRIAEKLFTCTFTRCSGCDGLDIDNNNNNSGVAAGGCDIDIDDDFEQQGMKRSSKEMEFDNRTNHQMESNYYYSYDDAEALTDEIEQHSQLVGEVFRIKEILRNSRDESEKVLLDCLRRLQLMALTVDLLKSTEIGKAVSVLRKHGSKDISNLARTLVGEWKILVDEWYKTPEPVITDTQGGTPDSVNPSVVEDDEEEGLPSPPLDDLTFFAAPPSMELSQFFDGMDDDGNPRNNGEFIKNRNTGRKPSGENQNVIKRKLQSPHEVNNLLPKENKSQQWKRQDGDVVKPNKPLNIESGPGRPPKVAVVEQKAHKESKLQQKPDNRGLIQRKLPAAREDMKSNFSERKLEAAKRKLQESYQQADNAKRQRKIQVMEIHDIPKQRTVNKNAHGRSFNRNRPNGR
ncbi:hypothetical protein ACFE04_015792 [Oxalis oulophora]